MTKAKLSVHRILCPTDFSEFAANAFAESVRVARWFGARVMLVHVLPADAGARGIARTEVLDEFRRFVNGTDHLGVPLGTLCVEGDASTQILRVAQDIDADLVVMGTHGRSGLKRLVLGSVTEAVLSRAPAAPVLTVNRGLPSRPGPFRTVLCATDMSDRGRGTIAAATAFADEGAERLVVLNVVEHAVEAVTTRQAALAALRELTPDDAGSSHPVERRVAFGVPHWEVLAVAEGEGADLIVMGSRRGGSSLRTVVRNAACPVLVVPAGHIWPERGLAQFSETVGAAAAG